MPWNFILEVLRYFGLTAAALVVLVLAAWPLIGKWLAKRVEVQVEEGMARRLANNQLTLDKDLERYRKELEHESDRARALLSKEGADYGIYAQRRHDAITRLFEEFLRLEVLGTGFADIRVPATKGLEPSKLAEFTERLEISSEERSTVERLFQDGKFGEADHRLQLATKKLTRLRVGTARNDAYEAYYRAALYLPDDVDEAAVAVRDQFHLNVIPYDVVTPESGAKIYENNQTLRSLMMKLQRIARAELSGAAPKS